MSRVFLPGEAVGKMAGYAEAIIRPNERPSDVAELLTPLVAFAFPENLAAALYHLADTDSFENQRRLLSAVPWLRLDKSDRQAIVERALLKETTVVRKHSSAVEPNYCRCCGGSGKIWVE